MYDVIIIGSGPAGLAAGLYGARANLKTLIIEKERAGGQIATTEEVANYPGAVKDETGPSLIAKMVAQTEAFGAEKVKDTVIDVKLDDDIKVVKCSKNEYQSKAVILATGAKPRKIGCKGEEELTGKGVSYCATCDGAFFTDLEIFAIGGGDTAVEEAMFLTKFAKKVNLVHRRDELRAAKSIQEKVFKNEKVNIIWDSEVAEIKGDGIVESVVLKNSKTGELKEYKADEEDGTMGVFVFIGYLPQTELFDGKIELERGYIVTDENMKTNVDGVFACGDVRKKSLRQVVTAVSDGAIAAVQAEKYIEEKFHE